LYELICSMVIESSPEVPIWSKTVAIQGNERRYVAIFIDMNNLQ
jgi:hypothetical protein